MNIERRRFLLYYAPLQLLALTVLNLSAPGAALGQKTDAQATRDSILATGVTAGESDGDNLQRTLIKAAEFNLGFTTVKIGGGLLEDAINYAQDDSAKVQFPTLNPDIKLRDARVLLGGRLKTKRVVTWQAGIMYDALTKKLLIRQSGVMIAVPEIWSHFFVGRAKEGFSLNKVMNGYDGWTMERQTFTDATVPLLADGIKWLGVSPDLHFFWNAGAFTDVVSEGQSFSSYHHQFVLRTGWVPFASDSTGTVLHLGVNIRGGKAAGGQFRLRSKPEAFEAPYFIDTGTFPAKSAIEGGFEAYFRPGRFLIGSEYYWWKGNSPETGNPVFNGGDIVATWLTTGETRSYNAVGSYFRGISPKKTVIQGGPGAWELVMRFSYSDLDGGTLTGGKFWRFTPMINWYLTDNLRFEIAYGYSSLDRFNTTGITQFFQTRIQFEL